MTFRNLFLPVLFWTACGVSFGQESYRCLDKGLRLDLIHSDPQAFYISMEMDPRGNLYVGGRDALYLFEANGEGGFHERRKLASLPKDTWAYSLQVAGDDLYVLTVTALYRLPNLIRDPGKVTFERVVWGIPFGHVHQGFHGMRTGPDGCLYLAYGDPHPGSFRSKTNPGHVWHWTFLSGPDAKKFPWTGVGGVIRYDPRSHDLKVISRGYRNVCDLDFDEYWNLFGNDNDQEGSALHTFGRLIHVTEGSHYQWSRGWLEAKEPYRNDLIKTIDPSLGRFVPFGTCYYNEDHLGADYQRSLFVARWGSRELGQFPLKPRGASFASRQKTLLAGKGTARPVAVFTGNGGRLFVSICFMQRNEASPVKRTDLVAITNPKKPLVSLAYDPSKVDLGKLLDEIESPSWKRRFNAHREIIARDKSASPQVRDRFLASKTGSSPWHSLAWLAGRQDDKRVVVSLRRALSSPNGRTAAAAADALRRFHQLTASQVEALLKHKSAVAQLAGLRAADGLDLEELIYSLADAKDTLVRQAAQRWLGKHLTWARIEERFKSGDLPARRIALAVAMWKWTDMVENGTIPAAVKLSPAAAKTMQGFAYVDDPKANLRTESQKHGFIVGGLALMNWWKATAPSNPAAPVIQSMIARSVKDADDSHRKTAAVFANTLGLNELAGKVPGLAQTRKIKADIAKGAKLSATKAMPPAYRSIDWTKAWKEGNAKTGETLFKQRCIACHDSGQGGGIIGPSLAGVANRFTPHYLAESVAVPSKAVSPNFQAWSITQASGKVLLGFLSGEDENRVILQMMDGSLKAVEKSTIKSKQASPVSLMPVGLITGPDELKHLVKFLMTLGNANPRGPSPPNKKGKGAGPKPKGASIQLKGKSNVILIFSDDMGYSDLPKFGKSEIPTPNIDRLAQEGTLFTDAYVTAPICVASRMGLLTGQFQQRFGIYGNIYGEDKTRLFLNQTLLPKVFQDAGYRTAHVGKWHLSGNKRLQYETAGPRERGFDESVAIRGGDSAFWKGTPVFRNGKQFPAPEYLTDLWGTEACAFIDRAHAQPFFLYLAYNAVHSPMHALDGDRAKFSKVEDENRRTYDGMLLAMDRSIGQVLDRLDKHGIADNTIVVFLNDNGGGGSTDLYAAHSRNYANNNPLSGHKFDVLEGGVRVPMIIRWPKHAPAGKVYSEMVSSTDVFPTLVAAAGLQMPKGQPADGVDLLPFINGKNSSKPHEWLCWQNRSWRQRDGKGTVKPTPKVHNSAIRKGNWKLVRMNEKIGPNALPPAWKLYDLKKDIGEQKDVAKQHGDIVKELGAHFDKWRSAMHPTVE